MANEDQSNVLVELISVIEEHSKAYPQSVAYVGEQAYTWEALSRKVQHYRKQLVQFSANCMLLYVDESIDSLALVIASSEKKATCILVASYYSLSQAREFMSDFGGGVLLQAKANEIITVDQDKTKLTALEDEKRYVGLLTSGTTGPPKCVKHTWASISAAVKVKPHYRSMKWFMGYPITHFAGMQVFVQGFINGGCLVVPNDFTPKTACELIDQHEVDYLNCTPTFIRQLFMMGGKSFGKSLKRITLGGEIVDQAIIDLIKQNLPSTNITHIYATTELGALIWVTDEKEGFDRSLLSEKFKVESGELYVKPTNKSMIGYLNQKQLEDSWVATNDLVKIEGDRVRFLGRKDDVINVGGFNVNPSTVEKVIRRVEGVLDVSVMGQKSSIAGNIVMANVRLDEKLEEAALRRQILGLCRDELPYYMVPRLLNFVNEIELTPTSKIIRRAQHG